MPRFGLKIVSCAILMVLILPSSVYSSGLKFKLGLERIGIVMDVEYKTLCYRREGATAFNGSSVVGEIPAGFKESMYLYLTAPLRNKGLEVINISIDEVRMDNGDLNSFDNTQTSREGKKYNLESAASKHDIDVFLVLKDNPNLSNNDCRGDVYLSANTYGMSGNIGSVQFYSPSGRKLIDVKGRVKVSNLQGYYQPKEVGSRILTILKGNFGKTYAKKVKEMFDRYPDVGVETLGDSLVSQGKFDKIDVHNTNQIVNLLRLGDLEIIHRTVRALTITKYEDAKIDDQLREMIQPVMAHSSLGHSIILALSKWGNQDNLKKLYELESANHPRIVQSARLGVKRLLAYERRQSLFDRLFSDEPAMKVELGGVRGVYTAALWLEDQRLKGAALSALERQGVLGAKVFDDFLDYFKFITEGLPTKYFVDMEISHTTAMANIIYTNSGVEGVSRLTKLYNLSLAISPAEKRSRKYILKLIEKSKDKKEYALSESSWDSINSELIDIVFGRSKKHSSKVRKLAEALADSGRDKYKSTFEIMMKSDNKTFQKVGRVNHSILEYNKYWYGLIERIQTSEEFGSLENRIDLIFALSPFSGMSVVGSQQLRKAGYHQLAGLEAIMKTIQIRYANYDSLHQFELESVYEQLHVIGKNGDSRFVDQMKEVENSTIAGTKAKKIAAKYAGELAKAGKKNLI